MAQRFLDLYARHPTDANNAANSSVLVPGSTAGTLTNKVRVVYDDAKPIDVTLEALRGIYRRVVNNPLGTNWFVS